jgi:hypothetical protein
MAKNTKQQPTPFSCKAKVITIKWEGCAQGIDTKNFNSLHEVIGALEYAKAQVIQELGFN